MNGFNIQFSDYAVIINVVFRLITAVIFAIFLLPLFFKEAGVRNGLRPLRIEMLLAGIIIFFINSIGLLIIVFRYGGFDVTRLSEYVTYFNSIGFLTYALIKWRIYTQNYTPENKSLHEEIHKLEIELVKKRKKDKQDLRFKKK